jgi:hypothetical protein
VVRQPRETYVCLAFDITLGTVDTVECEDG